MKPILIIISLLAVAHIAIAQRPITRAIKKELENHRQKDTFRVNRLNFVAGESMMLISERKKYADEALAISKKINYTRGLGFAYALLGTLNSSIENSPENKRLFELSDSIAKKINDPELKANVFWRASVYNDDSSKRDSLIHLAYSIASKMGNHELMMKILLTMADFAQNPIQRDSYFFKADSIAKSTNDLYFQARVLYNRESYENDLQKKDSFITKVIAFAEKSGDLEFEIFALGRKASYLISTGDKKGFQLLSRAEDLAQKSGNYIMLSSVQALTGSYYMSGISDYAKAMEYFLRSLHSAEMANDAERKIYAWSSLGTLYSYMGDQDNALNYLLKAEAENKKLNNKYLEADLQISIGERYRLMNKYPEAITAYKKYIAAATDPTSLAVAESNLADVYTRMGNLPLAFDYGFKSLKNIEKVNKTVARSWIEGVLSRAYLKNNMADSAIYYASAGLANAEKSGSVEMMRDNTLALSNAYAHKRDFEKAYINYHLYVNYRDSMMNEEVRNRTAVQRYTFDLDKKEAQISVLHEQKKGQRNLLIGAVVLLGLILAIVGLLFRNNRQKQKANKLLKIQKQEIDEKAQNVELLN